MTYQIWPVLGFLPEVMADSLADISYRHCAPDHTREATSTTAIQWCGTVPCQELDCTALTRKNPCPSPGLGEDFTTGSHLQCHKN